MSDLTERQAGEHEAVGGDFELTPPVVRALDRLARAARTDPAARNALYEALALKIARFLAPYRGRALALGDFADLEQEAFLVFVGLVMSWSGQGNFARYFLGFFPWRLRHAIEAHEHRWPRARLVVLEPESVRPVEAGVTSLPVGLLAQLGPLTVEEEWLLVLRLLEDRPLTEIAPLFGWSRRTAYRRWRALLDRLGQELAAAEPASAVS